MDAFALIDLRTAAGAAPLSARDLAAALPRAELDVARAAEAVRPVVEDVAARGAEAVREASERFDGIRPPQLRVPQAQLERALAQLDPAIRAAIEESAARVRRVDEAVRPSDATIQVIPGGTVTERHLPVRRVGLYVPGGRAVLPSSVIMNVVPAQVAGVEQIVVASPPQREHGGLPHPTVLAACALLGVDEVIAAGGAQAIALLAHGAGDVDGAPLDGVDLITGPGNVYVAAAKRLVRGIVGIDSEAGPTEIAIIADATADPRLIAADLISQAEHDPMAASVLITDSEELVCSVREQLEEQTGEAKHRERIAEALAGPQSGAVLVDDLVSAIAAANAYGAEHLEIHTADPDAVAARITCAGAVFVGPASPVSLGDYAAGSNHVLPTGGTARFSSGLGVHAFLRRMQEIRYDRRALGATRAAATALAAAEDLPAHGRAIDLRFER